MNTDSADQTIRSGGSRIISRVLPPAVRLWLHSQVEQVENLDFRIEGSDRQILSGYIPKVFIAAYRTVYQGLYLTQAQLNAADIRFNLGQVLRGKPLRLLESIPVMGEILLEEADLNESLQSPLLVDGLNQFVATLLQSDGVSDSLSQLMGALINGESPAFQDAKVLVKVDQLTLSLSPVANPETASNNMPIVIRTNLQIRDGRILILKEPYWLPRLRARQGFPLDELDGFELDLGPEVDIQELRLEAGQITCCGRINVIP
ncbi:MAG: DUF2993 domain-containing protein [Leptolyngbyaceae cyanobacterium MO_188.B28]|nr:DUF2993 domain-containing protein [Leptolyngbyaceae cyanobacterium MO_188.B28]